MTTIREEIDVNAPVDAVWQVVRDVGEAHRRLFPGILTDARLDELRGRIAGLMQAGAARAKATLEHDLGGRG